MIWRPDTCGCVLEYDGANDPKNLIRAINRCPDHPDDAVTLTDNQLKNYAVNKVEEVLKTVDPSVAPAEIRWRFDRERRMVVSCPQRLSITSQKRQEVETELGRINNRIVFE